MLALCDVVYASDEASFSVPFSSTIQSPEACSSYTFPRIMGNSFATEVLMFNKTISAEKAKELKFISDVLPMENFHEETYEIAVEYAKNDMRTLKRIKKTLRGPLIEKLKQINRYEARILRSQWESETFETFISKFFKKRKGKL